MTKFKSVDEYINSFDGIAKDYLKKIRTIVLENVPGTKELINYNIVAFSLVEGGKRDQQVMMAGYKHHVGFYPHPDTINHFSNQLNGFKKAKGSVQFSINKPLPERLIAEMVLYRLNIIIGNEQDSGDRKS